jgi:hypothetical protein
VTMLDPEWTPERGYSHADGLLAILKAHDEKLRLEEQERQEEEEG